MSSVHLLCNNIRLSSILFRDLSGNQIKQISPDAFLGLRKLQSLYVNFMFMIFLFSFFSVDDIIFTFLFLKFKEIF